MVSNITTIWYGCLYRHHNIVFMYCHFRSNRTVIPPIDSGYYFKAILQRQINLVLSIRYLTVLQFVRLSCFSPLFRQRKSKTTCYHLFLHKKIARLNFLNRATDFVYVILLFCSSTLSIIHTLYAILFEIASFSLVFYNERILS